VHGKQPNEKKRVKKGGSPLLLHVEENNGIRVAEQEHPAASVEDLVARWRHHLLGSFILQIFYDKLHRKKKGQFWRLSGDSPDQKTDVYRLVYKLMLSNRAFW